MSQQDIALVAFDLDHTLLRGETVAALLARFLGQSERMQYFETLQSQETFAQARAEMVSWYSTTTLETLCSYLPYARLAPGTLEGFALLRAYGIKTALVSTTWEFAVAWFARYFGADFFVGTQLSPDWQISHFWSQHKPLWLAHLAQELSISPQQLAAVGDNQVDVPMLRFVGHPFFVGPHLLPGIERASHHPNGDILAIVQQIIHISRNEEILLGV